MWGLRGQRGRGSSFKRHIKRTRYVQNSDVSLSARILREKHTKEKSTLNKRSEPSHHHPRSGLLVAHLYWLTCAVGTSTKLFLTVILNPEFFAYIYFIYLYVCIICTHVFVFLQCVVVKICMYIRSCVCVTIVQYNEAGKFFFWDILRHKIKSFSFYNQYVKFKKKNSYQNLIIFVREKYLVVFKCAHYI